MTGLDKVAQQSRKPLISRAQEWLEEELKREEESKDKPPLGSILPPMNASEPRKPKGGVIPP